MAKKILITFSLLFFIGIMFAESETIQKEKDFFILSDFYANPFINKESLPIWFDNYEQFEYYFTDYTKSEIEIFNKYTKGLDKEITVENENEILVYYLRSYDGKVFKKKHIFLNLKT